MNKGNDYILKVTSTGEERVLVASSFGEGREEAVLCI